ncbi:MAG: ClpXP protease specificity-enhancing factor SspB [Parvibaculum sp.]|uniref:SspB family protein n=1 Tax=Parvibaculum sp. TaxID=2024848 RepID=UPI002848039E|nr:ClpXP protease specificity-enhancing factor SspB [Parvibaculum sp.]MDR3498127.1 ClpXP protease specificity-enhancing factor SspB [Parvibaculum sp.]
MAKDFIGYQALTDSALRGVVRDALRRIEKSGLIGAHHFYLTFKTHADGVDIPEFLKEQYPDEMTIIIQHQYWALKVKEDYFEVTLTFKKLPAPLHIPFAALTAFFDPGVQFGLQFRAEGDAAKPATGPVMVPNAPSEPAETQAPEPVAMKPAAPEKAPEKALVEKPAPGEVVSLDSFRKK